MEQSFEIIKTHKIALISSIIVFLISLTQKCVCTDAGHGEIGQGVLFLIFGIFSFFDPPMGFIWLANLFVIVGWIIFDRKKYLTSLIVSAFAVCLSGSFLFCRQMMLDEGGSQHKIVSYELGYWLWLLSMIILLVGSVINYKILRKEANPL